MADVIGWTELNNASLFSAAYTVYDTYIGANNGWPVTILFFIFQYMLYLKTQNLTLCFITGVFFVSMYAVSAFVQIMSVEIMFTLLVLQLTGIFFLWVMK